MLMMINIKQIRTKSPLYEQERILRNKVLMQPIGLPDFGWEQFDLECYHFVAIKKINVIGCVLLKPINKAEAQLMQMAVNINFQNKGIGTQLIDTIIEFAKSQSFKRIICHSRKNAIEFYLKNGFAIVGKPFYEVGIEHRLMERNL